MERVILIGLSGTGKSTVARAVAAQLGYEAIDTDDQIVRIFDQPIPRIFRNYGQHVFRAAEREVLRDACERAGVVIATGGGVVLDEANWTAMRPDSVIVHLTATLDEITQRLEAQVEGNSAAGRPLLEGDPARRLKDLWQQRRGLYERADITVDTTAKPIAAVVEEILQAVEHRTRRGLVPVGSIGVPTGRSDLYVAVGLLEHLGVLARERWPEARRAWCISDDNVWTHWGTMATEALQAADFAVESSTVPAGESSKSIDQVARLYDWMIGGKIDRRDIVVALGGGVVGDLAGFVGSTVLRGVGLVQVPTSVLAMVDSSVGGKTGINHALGKNLIGSFYQPPLVVADPNVLQTLPERELRAGWAEIIKHAMIERTATGSDDTPLLDLLESINGSGERGNTEFMAQVIRHNMLLKSSVVRQDERESGLRKILNYGHTLGHAMEAAEYRYLHGEAIALGLRAASRLSQRLGLCDLDLVERQDRLLDAAALPSRFEGRLELVMDRVTRDKKAVHGVLTWILPTGPGVVKEVQDVPIDLAADVARDLGAA